MSISFGGLSSGLDTGSIISQLVAIRRNPIVRLEQRKDAFSQQRIALTGVEDRLKSLYATIDALDTHSDFSSLSAASTDEDRLTASAGALAQQGSYDIFVNNLATAQKERSQGFDSTAASVGTGTFSVTIGGETTDIAIIPGADTVADLASAINASDSGLTATILYDGSETGGYFLMLSAETTGTDAAFSLDASGLSGGTVPAFTNLQAAANASFTIDNLPITSQTNTIADAIQGVTLDLTDAHEVGDPPLHLEVGVDGEALQGKVQAFVDAYNGLIAYMDEQMGDDKPLEGDSAMRGILSSVRNKATQSLSSGSLRMLYSVGLSQADDNRIAFDTAKFQEELARDYGEVRDIFASSDGHTGLVADLGTTLDNLLDTVDGTFKLRRDSITARVKTIDTSIERYERSVDLYEQRITREFTAMESLISSLQAQGSFLYG